MGTGKILVTGGLLINTSEQFLVLESSKNKGKWVVPGGKIAEGESPIDAFSREVLEETGLHVRDIRFLGNRLYTSPRGNQYSFFDYSAVVSNEDDLLMNGESLAFAWISKEQLGNYEFSDSINDFFMTYSDSL